MRRMRFPLYLTIVFALGCASAPPSTRESRDEITILVDNASWDDVNVFLVSASGETDHLGRISGYMTGAFRVPRARMQHDRYELRAYSQDLRMTALEVAEVVRQRVPLSPLSNAPTQYASMPFFVMPGAGRVHWILDRMNTLSRLYVR